LFWGGWGGGVGFGFSAPRVGVWQKKLWGEKKKRNILRRTRGEETELGRLLIENVMGVNIVMKRRPPKGWEWGGGGGWGLLSDLIIKKSGNCRGKTRVFDLSSSLVTEIQGEKKSKTPPGEQKGKKSVRIRTPRKGWSGAVKEGKTKKEYSSKSKGRETKRKIKWGKQKMNEKAT